MLDPAEAAAVADQFGVSDEQVRRDHLLSHLLGVLARDLTDAVVFFGGTALARTHLPDGRLSEDPPLSAVRDVNPAVLRTTDGLTVRVQLLDPASHPAWPTEPQPLVQRYTDAPPATLVVPTLPAFGASKTAAWHDRRAPRDLYDLWGLAGLGALDGTAATLFARLGPSGNPPRPWMFTDAPTTADWTSQLAGQTRVAVGPLEALAVVREAWAAALTT